MASSVNNGTSPTNTAPESATTRLTVAPIDSSGNRIESHARTVQIGRTDSLFTIKAKIVEVYKKQPISNGFPWGACSPDKLTLEEHAISRVNGQPCCVIFQETPCSLIQLKRNGCANMLITDPAQEASILQRQSTDLQRLQK